ncbi:unnamed protein product [Adineta steineri]|uniref:Uncharacterized protein n=1 Tax=Adineta steineri TaxID=433720 RepID=A0A814KV88_9BILA|nr:unnamed protein product [Adineta steineri]CAF1351841.1 unnamed protein product [Adineta steineri]
MIEAPNYSCINNSSGNVTFALSWSSHSAWNPTLNCTLQQCLIIFNNNSSCRSSSTPCFDYRTYTDDRYCAPGIMCSLLEPCNNVTYACTSKSSVCAINTCCSPRSVCLPLSWTDLCKSVTNRTRYTACRSGNYDVVSTWCSDDIPNPSAIVVIPAPFTVISPARSEPEFARLDIYGIFQVHVEAKFPPLHPFTIYIFNDGILTDMGISNQRNKTDWIFPSNSILFIHIRGRINTTLPISICNSNSSNCTKPFNQTKGSLTVANTLLGKIMLYDGITFIAVKTGAFMTADTWCGGQVPVIDFCDRGQICNLIISPGVKMTVSNMSLSIFQMLQVDGSIDWITQ